MKMIRRIVLVAVIAAIVFAGMNFNTIKGYVERYVFEKEVDKLVDNGTISDHEATLIKNLNDEDQSKLIDIIKNNFDEEDFTTMKEYVENGNKVKLMLYISTHLSADDYSTFMDIYNNNQDVFKEYINSYLN